MMNVTSILAVLALSTCVTTLNASDFLVYQGGDGPGQGKNIVLVSGDEEYRSEEALPCLGKILSAHHGFTCTVLFSMTEDYIDPNNQNHIPGLQALDSADLMIIATRFRDLPDRQMEFIDRYLRRGGPVIGLRTASHAFKIPPGKTYSHYGNGYNGPKKDWQGGFGRRVLGEKWIAHHGKHGKQATRGIPVEANREHPILRGWTDIYGPTDVYRVRLPLLEGTHPLVLGAVLDGMMPSSSVVEGEVNQPMMPIAWTRTYQIEEGTPGRVFTTTMGAAEDLLSEGLRRLIVNAAYWCLGMEELVPVRANVDFAGPFDPDGFGFREDAHWIQKRIRPEDFQ